MRIVNTTQDLKGLVAELTGAPYLALDTEFMRDQTYWPKLCLIQVASSGVEAIIDPLADGIDLAPFYELLKSPAVVKVLHAARQDIEIFHHQGGMIPDPLFDSQIAAMVCGFGDAASYETLCRKIAHVEIDKSSRFTDWSRRPLSQKQLDYAIGDVTHLRTIYEFLKRKLEQAGRADWVREEIAALQDPALYALHPEIAWKRLKPRTSNKRFLAMLATLAAWREREAQARDIPRGRVLKDDVLADIAVHAPTTAEKLGSLRSLPRGFERSKWGEAILAATARGLARDPKSLPRFERAKGVPNGAATVELLKVLLRMTSERHAVAAKVIATVDDLERIAANDQAQVAALRGWRRELFGEKALALKHGQLALAIENGRVVAVEREEANSE
jgi:ribonuclease D